MEQFNYLKQKVNPSEASQWHFILNVWLVWLGGRTVFLFESSDFPENAEPYVDIMTTISRGDPKIEMALEAGSSKEFPRYLIFNSAQVTPQDRADIQAATTGPGDDIALGRLLKFGCLDPDFDNRQITRTVYHLTAQSKEFPKTDLMSFVCSERVAQPTEEYLRKIATPIKQKLQSTFQNVQVHWILEMNKPLKQLIDLFGKYVRGKSGGEIVSTPEGRKMFSNTLLDGEGYNWLEEIFGDYSWEEYLDTIKQYGKAVLALLIVKGTMDPMLIDPNRLEQYETGVGNLETMMADEMPETITHILAM